MKDNLIGGSLQCSVANQYDITIESHKYVLSIVIFSSFPIILKFYSENFAMTIIMIILLFPVQTAEL